MQEAPARTPPKPNYIYLTPLFLTLLPVTRVAFKNHPVVRDRLFFGIIGVGIIHGFYLISSSVPKQRV